MSHIQVDFGKVTGKIGMLHGMNNGPDMTNGNFSPEFAEMGVPFVRFHETKSPTTKCIEVPFVFPDFSADADDPSSYFFSPTDAVIAETVKQNITIMYRLGMGTESTNPRLFCTVPEDFDKWARICVNIIRHYNDGWANGFHYDIRYWEIWNEADISYWLGTAEEYCDLYEKAARAIKAHNPSLLVGGFAAAGVEHNADGPFGHTFLKYVTEHNVPLDFYSWHFYADHPDAVQHKCDIINKLFKQYHLEHVENINSEWHGIGLHGANQLWNLSNSRKLISAVSCAGDMIVMHRSGVKKAAYYDSDNRSALCGLWDVHGNRHKQFYAFKAFNALYQLGDEVPSEIDGQGAYVLAARNDSMGRILIANYDAAPCSWELTLEHLPPADMKVYILDETRNLELCASDSFGGNIVHRTVSVPTQSVVLVELQFHPVNTNVSKASVKLDRPVRPMKPQHCLCNTPQDGRQLFPEFFRDIGMDNSSMITNLHGSTNSYGKAIDVPYIFRNFSADPDDPASYFFPQSDEIVQCAVETGCRIMYRLGASREMTYPRIYSTVPKNFEKWADICLHIVRHYNDGWADGFRHSVAYWEVWNEPDNPVYWENGTPEQYFTLYETTVKKLKSFDPTLKVGGPALALLDESGYQFAEDFLAFVKEKNLPLDFFSWHCVDTSLKNAAYKTARITEIVRSSGLNPELIQDGWSCTEEYGNERTRFHSTATMRGAAFGTALMSILQDHGVDAANVLESRPMSPYTCHTNVHFDRLKPYYALMAFSAVYALGTQVEANGYGVYITASRSNNKACILITNYDTDPHRCEITTRGFGPCKAVFRTLDATRDLVVTKEEEYGANALLAAELRGYSAVVIELTAL